MGFIQGVKIFLVSFAKVWANPKLKQWFFKTLALTFVLALCLVGLFFFLGSWGLFSLFESQLYAGFAVVVWAVILLYLGGQIASLLLNGLVLVVGGESALTDHYFKEVVNPEELGKQKIKRQLKAHSYEVFSMLRTMVIASVTWPLFLFPLTIPVGVGIFAWAMASDSLAIAKKLAHLKGVSTFSDRTPINAATRIGLGVVPSALALVPILGWVFLPVLQVAGLELQIRQASQDRPQLDHV